MTTSETTPRSGGFDRVSDAFRNLEGQISEFRDGLEERRQKAETEFRKRTEQVTDQVKKGQEQLETQIKDTSLYKRLSKVAEEIETELDKRRTQFYEVFGIATQDDVSKINKKLNAISKKLNQLAKEAPSEL